MTHREQLLLEITTAKMRHDWAKAQVESGEASPALTKYVDESREELKSLVRKRDRPPKTAAAKK